MSTMGLIKPTGRFIVRKIQNSLYDFHITILECLLFVIVIGPAVILRTGFLSQQRNIRNVDVDVNDSRATKLALQQFYELDFSLLFEGEAVNFIFSVTSAPILMLFLCVNQTMRSITEERLGTQLKRYIGLVSRYYFVFLMGVICLSITVDVIKLNNADSPSGLLYAFLLGNNSRNTDIVFDTDRVVFPSYQAAFTGYIAAFLALSANMLLAGSQETIMRHFGRLLITMAVVVIAIMTNYEQFFAYEQNHSKMMLSLILGICAALYVVCIVLKGYSHQVVTYAKVSKSSLVDMAMNSSRDVIDMYTRDERPGGYEKIRAEQLSIEPTPGGPYAVV